LIQSSQLKPPVFFPFLETRVDKMIFLLAVTTLCLVLLTLFYQKTKLGIATRAVSENADAAKLMGINNDFTIALTFALAAIMAAISALLFYTYNDTGMKFSDGTLLIGLIPFAAAVVGGIGSLPGAVVGGFIIGMVQEMAAAFGKSKWQVLFIYGILVLVLLLKPSGIFGRNEGEKV
ncbi:MAG: branched-chain amino acid ABC transporter permease, partial [Bacilli bacterium]